MEVLLALLGWGVGGDKGWGEIRGGGRGKEDMGQLTAIRKPDFLWSVT